MRQWVCDTLLYMFHFVTMRKVSIYMSRMIGNKSHCLKAKSLLNQMILKVIPVAPTPAKKIIPHQVLLLGKHGHHNECVQVNAFTEHPEVVTAHQVKMNELRHFAAHLGGGKECFLSVWNPHVKQLSSLFQKPWNFSLPHTKLQTRKFGLYKALLNTHPMMALKSLTMNSINS